MRFLVKRIFQLRSLVGLLLKVTLKVAQAKLVRQAKLNSKIHVHVYTLAVFEIVPYTLVPYSLYSVHDIVHYIGNREREFGHYA